MSSSIDEKPKEIIIGHHVNDRRLPVVAKFRKNDALHMRVPSQLMDTPELKALWHENLTKGGQVKVDNVKLNAAVFGKTDASFTEPTDMNEKKQLIHELLEAKLSKRPGGNSPRGNDESDMEDLDADDFETGDVYTGSEIHVGYYTEDPDTPVYATIQYRENVDQHALVFRLEDKSHEHRTQVALEYINLESKFKKRSFTKTREYIKGLILPQALGNSPYNT